MLGLFGSKCPLGTREKTWIEWRMRWLADQFGLERLRKATVILPTDEFFSPTFGGDYESAQDCLDRMCRYMQVDPASVTLQIMSDDDMPGAAGLYQMRERSNICIAASQLAAPPELLSTLAHELAHELLLKGGHLTQDVADHEQVTDLLPVFLGTGIFLANATVQFTSSSTGQLHSWSISKQGYLSSIQLGYALALFAYLRGERRPPWAWHLRTDAAVSLRAGLKYLQRTGDSLFGSEPSNSPRSTPTIDDIIENLGHRSPTYRLGALKDIEVYQLPTAKLIEHVQAALRDRDADVRCEAVRVLGTFGAAAVEAVPELLRELWRGSDAHRATAASALGEIGAAPAEVLPALALALRGQPTILSSSAAYAIGRFGTTAEPFAGELLSTMEATAIHDDYLLRYLIAALQEICPDPKERIRTHFAGFDREIRQLVLGTLKDQGG